MQIAPATSILGDPGCIGPQYEDKMDFEDLECKGDII